MNISWQESTGSGYYFDSLPSNTNDWSFTFSTTKATEEIAETKGNESSNSDSDNGSSCFSCLTLVYNYIMNFFRSILSLCFSGFDETQSTGNKEEQGQAKSKEKVAADVLKTRKLTVWQTSEQAPFTKDMFLNYVNYAEHESQVEFFTANDRDEAFQKFSKRGVVKLVVESQVRNDCLVSQHLIASVGGETVLDKTCGDGKVPLFDWTKHSISDRLNNEESIYVNEDDLKRGDHAVARGAIAADNEIEEKSIDELEAVIRAAMAFLPAPKRVEILLGEGGLELIITGVEQQVYDTEISSFKDALSNLSTLRVEEIDLDDGVMNLEIYKAQDE